MATRRALKTALQRGSVAGASRARTTARAFSTSEVDKLKSWMPKDDSVSYTALTLPALS